MSMPHLVRALLVTSAFVLPSVAVAQDTSAPTAATPPAGPTVAEPGTGPQEPEDIEVSVPGGNEIVVTGRRDRNIARSSDQVVSVLGAAEIARTGEGNIAGALARVTGLSVVGSGFVYVRGLGDRYSLALLNGSPLPSPEPLRRVVPLDLFPTGVISSSLVQKSYSANYPGEFGGGVINLTTRSVPRDPFLSFGIGVSGDSETTGQLGYTYYGSRSDDTGFDNGERNITPALASFFRSGARTSSGTVDLQGLATGLVTSRNGILQRFQTPPNFAANFTGGKSFPLGGGDFGIVAAVGYSNKFTTREALQQSSLAADVASLETDFTQVNTDQRIVVNGLLGFGYEFGDNKIRVTNLYIRNTIKQARLALGNRQGTNVDFLQQKTAWYERQLINSQLVGEFDFNNGIKLDVRAGYANSQREAPDELFLEYVRTNSAADPFGNFFINRLNNGNGGDARITFSNLDENLYSGGADLSYRISPRISATVGGAVLDQRRTSSRRDFQFQALSNFPTGVALFRPDLLLQPSVIKAFGISAIETDEGNPVFFARLRTFAGYAKLNASFNDAISLDIGARFERGIQTVSPVQVFNVPGAGTAGNRIARSYLLPAATLTFQVGDGMQFRLNASKTIARPQFRELINQPFFDPDSNRQFRGNPLLIDSQLYNAEARFEYYFGTDQRVSASAFYKRIDNPIEAFITGGDLVTSFANAPRANLYGAEIELQKNFNLDSVFSSGILSERRAVVIGNYTYTKSRLKVGANDTTRVFGATSTRARDFFQDRLPLTGQSDHIANLQLGLEHPDRLSQQTLLFSYSSDRVVSRGLNGSVPQPDVIERPGFRLDLVVREGIEVLGREVEIKFEARNLTGRRHEEFQRSGSNRVDINTYDVGRSASLSAAVKF